jgi:quinohemoprotein ethanol dehydrogenase
MILPSSFGAHSWHPMSYSPRTGLVYIPTMQRPVAYRQDPNYRFIEGRQNFALGFVLPGDDAPPIGGALAAWDPIAQKEVWRVPQPELWNAGVMSTAGNLVFSGDAHGVFSAYRATDGTRLWSFRQQAGIMAGPISYAVDGVQYVAIIAGYGGGMPLMMPDAARPQQAQPMGRMLVFRIGGTARIADQDLSLPPANPPAEHFTPAQTGAGAGLYFVHCVFCHGGSVLPDLRRSGALDNKETWREIVIGGALSQTGMVSFAKWLSPDDAETIRAYVASDAAKLKAEQGGAAP